ncbi:MAG TPA: MarR family transcriptional regulator [Ilumatobacteraceae bacterium]|nr:MarR family transcriptional regulator [Ilumatobacteraceae bacterium]
MPRLDAERTALWRTFCIVASNASRQVDSALQDDVGISLAQFEILAALARNGGSMRVSDLCHELQEVASSLSRRLDRMVTEGYIERTSAASDRRGVTVVLLSEGRATWRDAGVTYRRMVQRVFAHVLTESDVAAMIRALTKVVEIPPEPPAEERWW